MEIIILIYLVELRFRLTILDTVFLLVRLIPKLQYILSYSIHRLQNPPPTISETRLSTISNALLSTISRILFLTVVQEFIGDMSGQVYSWNTQERCDFGPLHLSPPRPHNAHHPQKNSKKPLTYIINKMAAFYNNRMNS